MSDPDPFYAVIHRHRNVIPFPGPRPRITWWRLAIRFPRTVWRRFWADYQASHEWMVCDYCGDCRPGRGYCPGCCVRS